ncbi:MAG: NAD(P)/FAD-dependent oxidoreductase [Clostridiales bacterium]|nr:NAD(P)/FAD-dependent oxidoreductase [Clostridiales bacterium]
MHTVVIIGAGAAGLMAAGSLADCRVVVLERNEKAGKKLYISGKGRCNVTNDCAPDEFMKHVVRNPKFLYSAINGFTPEDTQTLLRDWGVSTKTERGNRVFPVSDKASDVIRARVRRAEKNGADIRYNTRVMRVQKTDIGFLVQTDGETLVCEKLLIATGGKSYSATGSTGDGDAFARALGHSVVQPRPSLVPFVTEEDLSVLAGLTLKNVTVRMEAGNKTYSEFGELLFTHNGVSGPTVLRLSAYASDLPMPMRLYIDLKPALDNETLDKRITSDFVANANRQLKNALDMLLPKALILPVLRQSGLSLDKKVNVLTKGERQQLVHTVKNFSCRVTATEPLDNAIVTAGGVDVCEVNPKTMQSKICPNLYFAGEVLNVDALTGGFNIQIAFSTAQAAAKAMRNKD